MKLFHNDMSVCAMKVRMVLAFKNIDWDSEHLNLRAGDQFKPAYIRINPKSVVPVLEHKGVIITESTVIAEYLDEVFPNASLMPIDPAERAKVRYWTIKLDAGLHDFIAVISFCIAFRFQLLARYKTQDDMDEFLASIKNPDRASRMKDVISKGLKSKGLVIALHAYNALLLEMDSKLRDQDYLVGNDLSLADFSFFPYVERLEHLGMAAWWSDKPGLISWYQRIKSTTAYKKGILDWQNQDYLELMKAKGDEAWPSIQRIIDSFKID